MLNERGTNEQQVRKDVQFVLIIDAGYETTTAASDHVAAAGRCPVDHRGQRSLDNRPSFGGKSRTKGAMYGTSGERQLIYGVIASLPPAAVARQRGRPTARSRDRPLDLIVRPANGRFRSVYRHLVDRPRVGQQSLIRRNL